MSAIRPTLRPVLTPARIVRVLAVRFFVLRLTVVVSLVLGPGEAHPFALVRRLLSLAFGGDAPLHPTEKTILFAIRLPRVLLAAVVGAALSLSGVVFQALLRNPLADPYILGISGGAAVGAIVGMIAGASLLPFGVPGLAFGGAMVTVALLFGVAGSRGIRQVNPLLLTVSPSTPSFPLPSCFSIAMSGGTLHASFSGSWVTEPGGRRGYPHRAAPSSWPVLG
jgi:iron complex transport system permease protein